MVHDIEFATVQKQVIDGLKDGNLALEKANAVFSIDEIEDILADTQEAVDKQREIDALLSGELTEVMKPIMIHLLCLRHISYLIFYQLYQNLTLNISSLGFFKFMNRKLYGWSFTASSYICTKVS